MSNRQSAVILSTRAYTEIINETFQHLETETGGILLGARDKDAWYVIESLDPGPNSVYQSAYFEYDEKYATHLANKVRARYKTDIGLIGLWHRHPGSFDKFSSTDDGTNRKYAAVCGGSAISGLVNLDPDFRMTFYQVHDPLKYSRLNVIVGDHNIPDELQQMFAASDLLRSIREKTAGRLETQSRAVRSDESGFRYGSKSSTSEPAILPWYQRLAKDLSKHFSNSDERYSIPPEESSAISDELLAFVYEEIKYLDAQPDYSYELIPRGDAVLLILTRTARLSECPPRLEMFFTESRGSLQVLWNRASYPCEVGVIRMIVTSAITQFTERHR